MKMKKNNNVYEINTRPWLKKFSAPDNKPTLKNVPKEYWKNLYSLGMDYVWLMGIWRTNESVIKEYCFEPWLVQEYKRALNDFTDEDVIGSPYSIDAYEINPAVGTEEELLELKEYLNSIGMGLLLDFVSNHFSVHSKLIQSDPELFLSANEEFYKRDSHTYFKSHLNKDRIFVHGRDPFFPAWEDTIQLNHFNSDTRRFMIDTVKGITKLCDGVRCDMAMLSLNNVFDNTWSGVLNYGKYEKPNVEFWKECISEVKELRDDFIFIGEAYWDLEWELQRLGFDYTYDKKLLDRLKVGQISEIKGHLMAEKDYQSKSVRFIENHDEERSVVSLGKDKSKAAAVIMSTISGMKLYYDGQFEGKKIKLPVQLGREPKEGKNDCLSNIYSSLLNATNNEIFKKGTWNLLDPLPSWEGSKTNQNLLAWIVKYKGRKRLIIVNYSRVVSNCRLKIDVSNYPSKFKLKDVLNSKIYYRKTEEVGIEGLFIELGPFKSHIFSY
jgi:hypothetical protein